jgi:hypothetical protein
VSAWLNPIGSHIFQIRQDRNLNLSVWNIFDAKRPEAGIVEGGCSRAIGHNANQANAVSQLANATAEPTSKAQGDESSARMREDFVGSKIVFWERFTVLSCQCHRAPGHVQKKLLLAISE